MKPFHKWLLAALATCGLATAALATSPIQLGGSIFPLTFINVPDLNPTDGFNQMEALVNAQTVGISTVYSGAASIPSTGTDTSQTTYSTSIQGNPLMQTNYTDTLVSTSLSSAAMTTLIASEAGRTIHPRHMTIMVSGTAATASGLAIECGDGTLLASWPAAELVSLVPVGLYVSTGGPALGKGLGSGCPASYGVYLSNVGPLLTTSTHVYTNVDYSVQ